MRKPRAINPWHVHLNTHPTYNVKYTVQFAKEYSDLAIGQQAVGQIPWGHNLLLLMHQPCQALRIKSLFFRVRE